MVFFNGYLLHQSLKNRTETSYRCVLVNHYPSCESLPPWTETRGRDYVSRADMRWVFPVAGIDPYAWKGYEQPEDTSDTRLYIRRATHT